MTLHTTTISNSAMATTDVVTYAGPIDMDGYSAICEAIKKKKSDKVLLVLATPGGDPHAGFRIARALQHAYGSFDALVPRYCKSAGTLVVIGASKLYLCDMGELGPVDIQVRKNDEIVGRNSGLDIIQAVTYLRDQTMIAFKNYVVVLTAEAGLSTRVASEISSRLTTGLYEPIAAQIDPMKIAEMQRAMEIAFEYGTRLADKSCNLRVGALGKLIASYPSHGFVIDRKEARSLFIRVERPEGLLSELSAALHTQMDKLTGATVPEVKLFTMPNAITGEGDEAIPNPATPLGGDAPSEPKVERDSASSSASPDGTSAETPFSDSHADRNSSATTGNDGLKPSSSRRKR